MQCADNAALGAGKFSALIPARFDSNGCYLASIVLRNQVFKMVRPVDICGNFASC